MHAISRLYLSNMRVSIYATFWLFSSDEANFSVEFPSDMMGLMSYFSAYAPLLKYRKQYGDEAAQNYIAEAKIKYVNGAEKRKFEQRNIQYQV